MPTETKKAADVVKGDRLVIDGRARHINRAARLAPPGVGVLVRWDSPSGVPDYEEFSLGQEIPIVGPEYGPNEPVRTDD
jgi:hypothetical protein